MLHVNLLIQKTTADDDDDNADKPKTLHNKFLESANLSQGEPSLGPETRVRSLDTDDFQNLMVTSLSNDTSMIKFSSRDVSHKLWENAPSHSIEESCKKCLYLDTDMDDFKNLISSFFPTDASLREFA